MTLNLIEALKTSIYSPKHTDNTKIHFNSQNKKNGNTYIRKSAFDADLYGTIYILD